MRGNSIRSQIPAGLMTVGMLSTLTGVSTSTIQRWVRAGWLEPGHHPVGVLNVKVFNAEQQARALRLARTSGSRMSMAWRHNHTRTNPDGSWRAS